MVKDEARKMACVLLVSGSDSSGGAGMQADIKSCEAMGVFATNAVTAITVQNTLGVTGVVGLEADFVQAQIDAVLNDIGANAMKSGMLATVDVIETVANRARSALRSGAIKSFVVDPVMVTAAGDRLVDADAVNAIRNTLLPLATVTTPNLREAALLLDTEIIPETIQSLKETATKIKERFGPTAVLLKGSFPVHDQDFAPNAVRIESNTSATTFVVDILYDGIHLVEIVSPKIETRNTHGTGCTLASALAARLAIGEDIFTAIKHARTYLQAALRNSISMQLGSGKCGPFLHSQAAWETFRDNSSPLPQMDSIS